MDRNTKDPSDNRQEPYSAATDRLSDNTGARAITTRDRDAIRRWAARHQAEPATGEASASGPAGERDAAPPRWGADLRVDRQRAHGFDRSRGTNGSSISIGTAWCSSMKRMSPIEPTRFGKLEAERLVMTVTTGLRRNDNWRVSPQRGRLGDTVSLRSVE